MTKRIFRILQGLSASASAMSAGVVMMSSQYGWDDMLPVGAGLALLSTALTAFMSGWKADPEVTE